MLVTLGNNSWYVLDKASDRIFLLAEMPLVRGYYSLSPCKYNDSRVAQFLTKVFLQRLRVAGVPENMVFSLGLPTVNDYNRYIKDKLPSCNHPYLLRTQENDMADYVAVVTSENVLDKIHINTSVGIRPCFWIDAYFLQHTLEQDISYEALDSEDEQLLTDSSSAPAPETEPIESELNAVAQLRAELLGTIRNTPEQPQPVTEPTKPEEPDTPKVPMEQEKPEEPETTEAQPDKPICTIPPPEPTQDPPQGEKKPFEYKPSFSSARWSSSSQQSVPESHSEPLPHFRKNSPSANDTPSPSFETGFSGFTTQSEKDAALFAAIISLWTEEEQASVARVDYKAIGDFHHGQAQKWRWS